MIDGKHLAERFQRFYEHRPPPRLFRAPGRVNLIGEHTDYNGGFVLPMAIDLEAAVAIAERRDRKICVHSVNIDESAEFDLDAERKHGEKSWLNFVEGAARILERRGFRLTGADILIWSDVPAGAGLSSSAALETAVGLALTEISGQPIDRTTLALVGQQTEHEFVGAKVGIMDQFASANARRGHALLLDCRSLEFEHLPLDTKNAAVVICDTNVKHNLASSEYNTRRRECEKGVEALREFLPGITQLRDVGVREFEKYAGRLPETIRRRCRHVVTEIERTLKAAEALKQKDLKEFGKLMWASHESLRDDFEVSSRELDLLVGIASECAGVLGARMTGGGFGGSTVNLIKREYLDETVRKISTGYHKLMNIEPAILVAEAGGGASEIIRAER